MSRHWTEGIIALLLASSVFVLGQANVQEAPHSPDQRGNLGPLPGEKGLWMPPNAGDERLVDLDSTAEADSNSTQFSIDTNPLSRNPRLEAMNASAAAALAGKLTVSQVPFQPWARALYADRALNPLEPHTRCKPSGGPRQFLTPYGVEFVDRPELQRLFIVDIGGPHTTRIVYMDGLAHPRDLTPGYLGHSTGRWDNETLVVDTVGFNERFWIDRQGLPHTDKLHLIERFTRVDSNTLKYQVTVDDPGAYTSTWTTGIVLRWTAGAELFEYVCQDNNHAPELMMGTPKNLAKGTAIVP